MGDGAASADEGRQLPGVPAAAARGRYADADPARELEVLAEWIAAARALLRDKPA